MRWFLLDPIRRFIWVSAVFGVAFVLFIPPFQGPDEYTHFTRAYEVSNLQTAHRHHEKKVDLEGSYLPSSIQQTSDKTMLFRMPHYPDVPQAKKYFLNQTRDSLRIPLNKNNRQFYDTGAAPAYIPLLYAPQALVIKILETLGAPIILMLYFTRLVCLLIWISLGVFALKKLQTDKLKLGVGALLLLPMFIAQATVPGTDAILTGASLLFFVEIYNALRNNSKLTFKQNSWLTALLFIMVMAKPVYLVFGLFMLLTKTKYRVLPGLIFKLAGTILIGLIYVVWSYFTRYRGGPVYINSINAAHAAPGVQLHYILPNVFNFVEPLFNTLFLGWGDGTLVSLIGTFGLLDTPLPLLFVLLGYALAFFAVFAADKEDDTRKSTKQVVWTVVTVSILYIVGVLLSMYIISTPPRTAVITGVQGRYFLPVLLMLAVFMPKVVILRQRSLRFIYSLLPIILLPASILVVWLRYYVIYPK